MLFAVSCLIGSTPGQRFEAENPEQAQKMYRDANGLADSIGLFCVAVPVPAPLPEAVVAADSQKTTKRKPA